MRKPNYFWSLGILAIALFSFSFNPSSPNPPVKPTNDLNEAIQWMSWEEAQEAMAKEPKKIVVDIYTDWCGWCKRMDAATFQQNYIAEYINENYYAVKFNAEQKEDIEFQGKKFKFVDNGRRGYHELAANIMNGRLGYPTIAFLDEEMNVIQAIPGYKGPEEFEQIMTYFAGDHHKKVSWDKYQANYTPLPKE